MMNEIDLTNQENILDGEACVIQDDENLGDEMDVIEVTVSSKDKYADYEFASENSKKRVHQRITPFHCESCDKYVTRVDVLRNHLKTEEHRKRLERLDILKEALENGDPTCAIPMKNNAGDVIAHAIVDTKVYPLIMDFGISMSNGYPEIYDEGGKKHRLHRYIYYILRGIIPPISRKIIVDHKNRNKLDATMGNLREISVSLNNRNKDKRKNATSKYFGVTKVKNFFICALRYNGVCNIFRYDDEIWCAYHYDLMVKECQLDEYLELNNVKYPEGFIRKERLNKKRSLPTYISKKANSTKYECTFYSKDLKDKTKRGFDTIEEAVEYRNAVLKEYEEENIIRPFVGPIRRINGIAVIKVTNDDNNRYVGETFVDDDIYLKLMTFKYVVGLCDEGYFYVRIGGNSVKLTHFIMNYDGNDNIDHINNDTSNSLRSNLRIATHKQNNQNRRANKNAICPYVGVSYAKKRKKWRAYIGGKHLGYVNSEKEAVILRNTEAKRLNDTTGSFYKIESWGDYPPTIIDDCSLELSENLDIINSRANEKTVITANTKSSVPKETSVPIITPKSITYKPLTSKVISKTVDEQINTTTAESTVPKEIPLESTVPVRKPIVFKPVIIPKLTPK